MRSDTELLDLNSTLRKKAYEVLRPILPAVAFSSKLPSKEASEEDQEFVKALALHYERP